MMRSLTFSVLSLFSATLVAQNTSIDQLPFHAVHSFAEAFTEGQPALHLRARVEYVDQDKLAPGQANTLNTRLSFSSGHYQGFAGLIAFSNTTSYFNQRHNPGLPMTNGTRPVIPDPKGTNVNRSFLQYNGIENTLFNFGRQWITLDNERFIGKESFRQTPQSFDSISVTNKSLLDTEFFYAYLTEANNSFNGNDRAVGQHKSRSHILNASWTPVPFVTGTAFAYILNNVDIPTDSSDTYGLRLSGEYPLNDTFFIHYAGDYARQYGQHKNPVHYKVPYYHTVGGIKFLMPYSLLDQIHLQMGYEVFGADKGNNGLSFQTPVGSNYDFNGLTGQFVQKPAGGLKDRYLKSTFKIQNCALQATLHQFKAKTFPLRYGHEWDFGVDYHFNENFTVGVAYGHLSPTTTSGLPDIEKFWLTAAIAI